jgi:hypothetical protein
VNTYNNELLQISPEEAVWPIHVDISPEDYLASYGFKAEPSATDDTAIQRRTECTEYLKGLAVTMGHLVGEMNGKIVEEAQKGRYPLSVTLRPNAETKRLVELLDGHGLVRKTGPTSFQVLSRHEERYLTGAWFEEYVFLTARRMKGVTVRLNVNGTWDAGGGQNPRNEFDVLIGKNNRLYYISCKTVNPNRMEKDRKEPVTNEYLYELLALGDRALGLFGKKMLASARSIESAAVRERAAFMNIVLVDGDKIDRLGNALNLWLTA